MGLWWVPSGSPVAPLSVPMGLLGAVKVGPVAPASPAADAARLTAAGPSGFAVMPLGSTTRKEGPYAMSNVNDVVSRAFASAHSPELSDAIAEGISTVLEDLHAMLFPELRAGYDPDHEHWAYTTDEEVGEVDCFQWDSETIDHVAERIDALRVAVTSRGGRVELTHVYDQEIYS